ncbi:MAG TPA: L-seryl-tRNA(Sec) selenium transferase [Vicinamibacterales bacterium]|nr:L-seryl-tRNA(Sec) selenium transferase [Vicinamibacterales bacterium]
MTHLRLIPSIDSLRRRPRIRELEHEFGGPAIVDALRRATGALRAGTDSTSTDREAIATLIEGRVDADLRAVIRPSLRRVVNATGVLIHTNLGRSPLAPAALDRLREVATSYSNLEYDLAQGGRGGRDIHAEGLLRRLLDIEAAVVVNNNAAATMLILAALAAGREVIVSRGELVEIGGGFRVPDVMAQSGALLREVGTTNKTRVDDYRAAIGDRTALILRVHRSNFRIEGFTEQPSLAALAALGRERGIPVVEDLGSGYIGMPGEEGDEALDALLGGEPRVAASLAAGIDVVCFSGDKLLGGPQAGIIVGRQALIDVVRRHPLMRALRVDKLTYAALEATLGEYLAGRAGRTLPLLRMLRASAETVGTRAEAVRMGLADAVAATPGGNVRLEVVDGESAVGGGTTPGLAIRTRVLAISLPQGPDWLDARLRGNDPPVVGRIERDRLLIDLRTVAEEDDETVLAALSGALQKAED